MFHRQKTDERDTNAAPTPKTEPKPAAVIAAAQSTNQAPVRAPTIKPEDTKKMPDEPQAKSQNPQSQTASRPLDIPAGPGASYSTQPARVQNSVYSAAGFAAPGGQPQPVKSSGRRLTIGPGITLSGEIEACEHLVVEGTVEATLKGASVLEISETGMFYGTVEIDEATVAGRFEGDITCKGRLSILASGSVTGTVVYKELAIEAGATLDGKVNPLGGSKAATKKGERPVKKVASRNDNEGDNGVELPLTGTNNG